MEAYTLTREELEDSLDIGKVSILQTLVDEGVVDKDVAEIWGATHTVILRKKGFFRTLSDLWKKTPEVKGLSFLCVKVNTIPKKEKKDDTNVLSPDEEVRST
jgi:hypothetical protein